MIEKEDLIEQLNRCELVSDKVIAQIIKIIGNEKWQELNDDYNDTYCTMGEVIIALQDEE